MAILNRTIVGVFSSLSNAERAASELRSSGFSAVRLVENDQDIHLSGVTQSTPSTYDSTYSSDSSTSHHKEGGIKGFFSRLFGMDDDNSRNWNMSSDSERYFKNAYENRHHLVIVDGVTDSERVREILVRFDGQIEEQGSELYERELLANRSLGDTNMGSEKVMELREEQLQVGTERIQTGEVHLHKEIITETRTVEVPLTREEIVVERRVLDGVPHPGSISASTIGDTETIRIPVSEEQVHIEKTVVPVEEVRVSKETQTTTEVVSEEVRHEEARIEAEGRVSMRNQGEKSRPSTAARRASDDLQPGI